MIAIFWTALHPTNEEDVDNWSPATTITTPTIITATTATVMTTTTATTNNMFSGSRLGQLESNNYNHNTNYCHSNNSNSDDYNNSNYKRHVLRKQTWTIGVQQLQGAEQVIPWSRRDSGNDFRVPEMGSDKSRFSFILFLYPLVVPSRFSKRLLFLGADFRFWS